MKKGFSGYHQLVSGFITKDTDMTRNLKEMDRLINGLRFEIGLT